MTEKQENDFVGSLLIMATLAFFIGAIVGGCLSKDAWRKDAINRGFAHYNQTSGEWEWLTNKVELP